MIEVPQALAEALAGARDLRDDEFGIGPRAVSCHDQFAAELRVQMTHRFGVDLGDPLQRRAAFAGAWSIFEYLTDLVCPVEIVAGVRAELGAYAHLEELAR